MLLGTPVSPSPCCWWPSNGPSGIGIFDPALGGDPILFQHLFWFYSHPAVYIMILPSMGVVSEMIPCFSRKPIFGYNSVAFSSIAIAVLRLSGLGPPHVRRRPVALCGLIFSFLSFLVAVPSAIKVFNWTATLYKGSVIVHHADAVRARLYRPVHHRRPDRPVAGRASASTFTSTTPISWSPTSTTSWWAAPSWVTWAGMHFWWPKMTGRMYPEGLGEAGRADHLRRLQPDVLPAVHPRLPGHAAPLLAVSAGVPGAQRDVLGRGVHSRGRLSSSADLLPLVAALRQGPRPIRGAHGPGVDDAFAAADFQFRRSPESHVGGLRLRTHSGSMMDLHVEG